MTREFKQIVIPTSVTPTFKNGEDDTYSNNLLEDKELVVGIAIYAQPGTRFLINQSNDKIIRPLIINNLGVFQMDVQDRPLTGIYIRQGDYKNINTHHNVIIDLICVKEVEDNA